MNSLLSQTCTISGTIYSQDGTAGKRLWVTIEKTIISGKLVTDYVTITPRCGTYSGSTPP